MFWEFFKNQSLKMPNIKTPTQKMGVFQCPLFTGFATVFCPRKCQRWDHSTDWGGFPVALSVETAFQTKNRHPCLPSAYEYAKKPDACFLFLKSVVFYELK